MTSSTFKQRALDWIGYDPEVDAAASSAHTVKSAVEDVPHAAALYVKRLFPFTNWILSYNFQWAIGDLVAGLTVGMVVVPQSMSYAKIATLPVEYGLYSSFVGVMIYALFATSKDVTIGPVAVMSLEVSKVIAHVQAAPGGMAYSAPVIATALAFITGFIVLAIGLLRLGWIVEFIPAPAVAGFMTGSAISILVGQVPSLMGYSTLFNTRAATYKVIINSLKHLPNTTRDAAFGLSGLFFLYAVRFIFTRIEARARNPLIKRAAFFINTLRTAFVIIFLTIFAWVHLRHKTVKHYDISILKTVPKGFEHMGRPKDINSDLIGRLGPLIPVSTIILLLEHIAIAKSFGRVNNYKIDPNQELIAIGVTNTIGTLFNAYPATGSFSRSAIKSKAGVRTPLAGWVTGIVVVIALYALTGAFYWIPNAALSAVIIHAVGDLIASPRQVYGFWKVSPIEAIIFLGAVIITVFTSIEIGIYSSVGASAALLLYRIARPKGQFLGRVRVRADIEGPAPLSQRDVYVPRQPDGIRNPNLRVDAPPPGVIIYRFDEAFLYPNASYYSDVILAYAKEHTRSGQDYTAGTPGDRPWNDPAPSRWAKQEVVGADGLTRAEANAGKPLLRAVIFDFSGVSNVDTTSVQNLVDLRRVLERYADQPVEFHFATILSPWIKRALLAGGFGTGANNSRPIEIAPVVQGESASSPEVIRHFQRRPTPGNGADSTISDIEGGRSASLGDDDVKGGDGLDLEGPVVSSLTTTFHLDLASAVNAAVGDADW
ncbi:solute carrier family 26 (sodium-independent sulfate anion transporter), member 11, partial [Phenoliferia sp. Uapishka_3]